MKKRSASYPYPEICKIFYQVYSKQDGTFVPSLPARSVDSQTHPMCEKLLQHDKIHVEPTHDKLNIRKKRYTKLEHIYDPNCRHEICLNRS